MPRRFGQHFLADQRVLSRLVEGLRLRNDELVIEIGAGRGVLTAQLAERAAKVVAIELDPPLVEHLREEFEEGPVEVLPADVLALDFASLPARYGFERGRVVGNLPYYITSPILMRLFEAWRVIPDITVMVQLEVANRLTAHPGSRDYGYLSAVTQYFTRAEYLFRVPAGAFRPPPKVTSAIVRLTVSPRSAQLGIPDDARFLEFVGECFRQKRKTLLNNLKARYGAENVANSLEAMNRKPAARAEELEVADLARLYRCLQTE